MRDVHVIGMEAQRLLKAKNRLTMDFHNKIIEMTEAEYEAKIKEMNVKLDALNKEEKEARNALKLRFGLD
jgi:hypothetical protein